MRRTYSIERIAYRFILPTISATLLILTYPKSNLWFLAWIAFIPFFYALEDKSLKERLITGYIFGVVFFSGILYWLANVTVPGTIILILLLSIAPALFSLLYAIRYTLYTILFVPAAWVLTEYLRTHLLSGFPWALLGYSQSFNLPVIQIADTTGVYGVSFLIVLVNFGIYLALKKAPRRFYPVRENFSNGVNILFFIFLLFTAVFAYGQNRMARPYPTQMLKVALIQGNIPQEEKWDPQHKKFIIDKHKAITKESLRENPHLVIWPETSVSGYLEDEADLKDKITNLARSGDIHLLLGTLREEDYKTFNSATLISNKGEILESYDKIHLVPFGEFVPFGKVFAWVRRFVDKPIADFDRGREFTVFEFKLRKAFQELDRIQTTTQFYSFSTLICFEDIFPDLCRNFVKKGARFLVNITNDAWFGKTTAPYQHAQGSIFRAVENRVPVVRAANTGFSCIIDHRGKILKSVREGEDEIFVDGCAVGTIEPTFSKTIYTRFGDVFSWGCIAYVLAGLVFAKIKNEKNKSSDYFTGNF